MEDKHFVELFDDMQLAMYDEWQRSTDFGYLKNGEQWFEITNPTHQHVVIEIEQYSSRLFPKSCYNAKE